MSTKPLGTGKLPEDVLKKDKKACRKYDQCGIGDKAVYLPSRTMPRAFYVPFEQLERVYKRVAVSPGSGKAFLTPILYIVFQYDGGQEKEVYFKYLNEADKLFDDLEKHRPDLPLLSEANEKKQLDAQALEEQIRTKRLDRAQANEVARLENAKELLNMRPKLYRDLAGSAALKRKMDNIRPAYQKAAWAILAAGGVLTAGGIVMMLKGLYNNTGILLALVGIAAIFMMLNSRILPAPKKNRKYAAQEYKRALDAMALSLRKTEDFPLPAAYAHPYVCDRMIRLIRMEKAADCKAALEQLKEELKKMDSSVQLGGEEYVQVVTIKPMFLVQDYA